MKKVLKIVLGVVLTLAVLIAAFVVYTTAKWNGTYSPPMPTVTVVTSPEAIARGERLFRSVCLDCHTGPDGRASGKTLTDFPAFIGEFHSGNLTSDATHGIGNWSDPELARFIRTTIGKDGKPRAMPSTGKIGDSDVAAIIAFMRSGDPLFAPAPVSPGSSKLTVVGTIIFTWLLGIHDDMPASLRVPPAAVSAEYGKYVAGVYDCGQCHTGGFSFTKDQKPGAYGGGFEFEVDSYGGKTVISPNLTFDATGLGSPEGKWTSAAFITALRDGITPDGRVLRVPMPRFRYTEDVELAALYEFLKTLPHVNRPKDPGTAPETRASGTADPEALWNQLGCPACHGEGAPFRDKLKQSIGRPVADVASWIRDPQAQKPGTQMPTFRDLLDEPRSLALAAWVQARAAAMK
jgi:mono/diheme cytochrome c family protein